MHEALVEFVNSIKADYERIQAYDEAATKQAIILRIFHLLGWNVFDELVPEYPVLDGRVDFAAQRNGKLFIFVEVKRVGARLEDNQEQLLRYAFNEGVQLGVLTNGVSWWLYLPLAGGSWEERRFFAIDLVEQDSPLVAGNLVRFLARSNVISGQAVESAEESLRSRRRESEIEKTLPRAWNKIIEEPDEILLDLLIETTETLCGYRADPETAAKFLATHRSHLQLAMAQRSPQILAPSPLSKKRTRRVPRVPGGYTGTRPISFTFVGNDYPVSHYRELLLSICEILHQHDPYLFESVSLSLRGHKRPYFSHNPNELRSPAAIGGSSIFAETHLSASDIVRRCRTLVASFGYDPDKDFNIEIERA